MTRYVVQHVADPFEHHWEFHIWDHERDEAVAICGRIVIANILCDYLNAPASPPKDTP